MSLPPLPPQIQSAPPMLDYATPVGRTDLRTVALRQKAIMYCILGYLACAILQMVAPFPLNLMFSLAVLAAAVTGAVFVFMLCFAIYSTGTAVVLGILTLVPLVGLIVLLIVNGKATGILRQRGLRVGLMGADMRQIPAPGQFILP